MLGKVSVIIPIYNGAKYIPEIVDRIKKQTYANWELILVNDGSTDNSYDILMCEAHRDNRIRVLNKENGGICSARNYGLENATGEYIAFSDQDDEPKETMLFDLVNGMVAGIDMVVGSQELCLLNEKGLLVEKHIQQYDNEILNDEDSILRFIVNRRNDAASQHIWNCLYRRNIIDENEIGFDVNFKYGLEDFIFNARYAAKSKGINKISKNVYCYKRRKGESTSTKKNPNAVDDFIRLVDWYVTIMEIDKSFYRYQLCCSYTIRTLMHIYKEQFWLMKKNKYMLMCKTYVNKFPLKLSMRPDEIGNKSNDFFYFFLDRIIRLRTRIKC